MNDAEYRALCLDLTARFADRLSREAERTSADDPLRELAAAFGSLAQGEHIYDQGPELVTRLFTHCPEFAPLFPRDLLWFIGGDCLHFMPDEEMEKFQALEDLRVEAAARGGDFDYHAERAKLLNLQ